MNKAQRKVWRLAPKSLVIFGAFTILISHSSAFGQRAEDIIFTSEKVKTIPGHGMSKGEYPYDEDGFYHKEWVSTSARSNVKSSTTYRMPIPLTSEEHSNYNARQRMTQSEQPKKQVGGDSDRTKSIDSIPDAPSKPEPGNYSITLVAKVMTDDQAKREGFIGPYSKMLGKVEIPSASRSLTEVASSTKTTVSTFYHKVNSGDTLFAISRKYGVTVDAVKKANGLTSDLIRVGQSLRLALAQHTLGIPQ